MASVWPWDDMLAEFRALGGIAENVVQRDGAFGKGLFPVDPAKPFALCVPPPLLVDTTALRFDGATLRIREDARVDERTRKFFARYQDVYGWGGRGGQDCRAFVDAIRALPHEVRAVIEAEFAGLAALFLNDTAEARARAFFLNSRRIDHKGTEVLMPVMELVNHSAAGAGYEDAEGIALKGMSDGEILARYQITDAFGCFRSWGFANAEPLAFSLHVSLEFEGLALTVRREVANEKAIHWNRPPNVTIEDGKVVLSHLVLGHAQFPRLAKSLFYWVARENNLPNQEELFDAIQHANRTRLLKLVLALDGLGAPVAAQLRRMCIFQLQALSSAVGTRAI